MTTMMKTVSEKKFPIFLSAVAFSLFLLATFLSYVKSPVDQSDTQVIVEIPRGASFTAAVSILSDAGLIKHKALFYSLARLKNAQNRIRAGEYELSTSMSPAHILEKMIRGEIADYGVTIPEGYDLRSIAGRLTDEKLIRVETFMKLTRDRAFLSSLGIEAASAEGYLFPDTYTFTKKMSEKEIITMMINRFNEKVTQAMITQAEEMGFSREEFVTLASLIEKEAKLKSERPLISAVFHNRLRKGMKLQCDPTAVYGLEGFEGSIKRSHLRRKSSYNTYVIHGLPPGPIASPGMESLMAALNPAPVDYIYFVAKNDGSHQFSSNLRSHNQAVSRYQNKKN
jgi:UPF0755 protein